jgi:hypothetical protein
MYSELVQHIVMIVYFYFSIFVSRDSPVFLIAIMYASRRLSYRVTFRTYFASETSFTGTVSCYTSVFSYVCFTLSQDDFHPSSN